ncbi:hypothetical protein H9Q10_00775 [Eikenella sp. S3360]|uniref:PilS cassette n=1 Tax=Eikenella glucosivorans TaxID=2766967 RepID=A0ABS0N7D2_9NEIS|nr:hypothetical protein [Eikenella glucosivorans]MBH5328206.1 hypothetical protein [Eikenella glucosivorans]
MLEIPHPRAWLAPHTLPRQAKLKRLPESVSFNEVKMPRSKALPGRYFSGSLFPCLP